ncbi:MAG: Phosphoribosylformylglycinamidine synthase I [Candidatus Peregrinibacteria bacterium GW2011_GWA2_47_7]|nr:MAG: Phosphoribosylformylglycinamidine synthase I [Candidatus Peregrinibacteria bacterium GW2011_GWA2_47_7]
MSKIPSIAIIQFPGVNTEYETRREINNAGMNGEFFRWNDDPKKLKTFDGFILPGGFSYEDRGRAGLIASLDPLMQLLIQETENGKPLLGICNGAQMAVESGMVPDVEDKKLSMALARNKRMQDGKVLGTGYYNDWVHIKHVAPKGRTAFTLNLDENSIINLPIAHGEGRFTTTIDGLLDVLIKNQQTVFRYCAEDGRIKNEFPINPNGALYNLAAICNPAGNVMAIMPHHERSKSSFLFFESMRDYILGKKLDSVKIRKFRLPKIETMPKETYAPEKQSMEFLVDLIITDNEADTLQSTIRRHGFETVTLRRKTHYEVACTGSSDAEKLPKKLVQSGVLLNTNKETVVLKNGKKQNVFNKNRNAWEPHENTPTEDFRILVREKQDFVGLAKVRTLQKRLKLDEVTAVHKGVVWEIHPGVKSRKEAERIFKNLMDLHIFHNPHAQNVFFL